MRLSARCENLHLSYKRPTFNSPPPNSASQKLYQSPQPVSKQRSQGSRNLAAPLGKMHTFLTLVMAVWLHLFLERKLKHIGIKSNIHASSNKSAVMKM